MAYSVQADLEKALESEQLVQLADDNDDGAADAAVVAEVIVQADAVIDSYLATRYTVPVAPVPALVRGFSVAIAIHRLFTRRNLVNEARVKAHAEALKVLQAIADGKATLGLAEADATEQGGPAGTRTEADRIFTIGRESDASARNTLKNF